MKLHFIDQDFGGIPPTLCHRLSFFPKYFLHLKNWILLTYINQQEKIRIDYIIWVDRDSNWEWVSGWVSRKAKAQLYSLQHFLEYFRPNQNLTSPLNPLLTYNNSKINIWLFFWLLSKIKTRTAVSPHLCIGTNLEGVVKELFKEETIGKTLWPQFIPSSGSSFVPTEEQNLSFVCNTNTSSPPSLPTSPTQCLSSHSLSSIMVLINDVIMCAIQLLLNHLAVGI